jgi:coenzyme Q-binding protein COQ10
MSAFTESIAIKAPIEHVFETITDFDNYPTVFPEIEKIEVHSHTKTRARVTFQVKLMKSIRYTLDFHLTPPEQVRWSLVEGELMKSNDGSWTFSALDEKLTDAVLEMEVHFSLWVPKSLGESVIKGEMHKMLSLFKKAAESRGAKKSAAVPHRKPSKKS